MELGEIEDFRMIGAMGGLLYGMRGDQIAARYKPGDMDVPAEP